MTSSSQASSANAESSGSKKSSTKTTLRSAPPPAATEVATTPAYRVHLASFRQRETAESEWRRLLKAHGDLLADLIPTIRRVDLGSDKGIYYRLHAGPLADAEAAESLCRKLAMRQVRCLVTPAA